jgi:hypothetical protein
MSFVQNPRGRDLSILIPNGYNDTPKDLIACNIEGVEMIEVNERVDVEIGFFLAY